MVALRSEALGRYAIKDVLGLELSVTNILKRKQDIKLKKVQINKLMDD